jgi:hypothetical protein
LRIFGFIVIVFEDWSCFLRPWYILHMYPYSILNNI